MKSNRCLLKISGQVYLRRKKIGCREVYYSLLMSLQFKKFKSLIQNRNSTLIIKLHKYTD